MIMNEYEMIKHLTKIDSFIPTIFQPIKVMVVDDQPLSLLCAVDLLKYEGYEVFANENYQETLKLAFEIKPDIILMDAVMPEITGLEIAKMLKHHPQTQTIPIILMSVVEDQYLWHEAMVVGVDEVIAKPLDSKILCPRLNKLAERKRLNEGLDQTQKVLFTLAMAIENRSSNQNSSLQLANLVIAFAEYLQLNKSEIEDLVYAAYLHDIGTIGIREDILSKKETLTDEENKILEQHVIIGEEICQPLKDRQNVLAIIRHHHEKWDGSGYPDQLRGDNIPFLAQVFQIADIYDALTTERYYKSAYKSEKAIKILREEANKGWRNPKLVEQFIQFIQDL